MATAKKAAKKATTKKVVKKRQDVDVSFTEDIPKIQREGFERRSKYDELLDTIYERAQDGKPSTAVLTFDSTGKATSRYTSVKEAVSKREDADQWTVAVRTHAEDDVRLYVKWSADAEDDE